MIEETDKRPELDILTLARARARAEAARLAKLESLRVLDTVPNARIDRIVELTAKTLRTPIALVSLVDADRQWFKAKVGFDLAQMPRSIGFCTHAIRDDAIMVVPDAMEDPRFADNPLVTGDRHFRFYAGKPIVVEGGHRIGALCVIDCQARGHFGPNEQAFLTLSADVVMQEIVLQRRRVELEDMEAELDRRHEVLASQAAHLSKDAV